MVASLRGSGAVGCCLVDCLLGRLVGWLGRIPGMTGPLDLGLPIGFDLVAVVTFIVTEPDTSLTRSRSGALLPCFWGRVPLPF